MCYSNATKGSEEKKIGKNSMWMGKFSGVHLWSFLGQDRERKSSAAKKNILRDAWERKENDHDT